MPQFIHLHNHTEFSLLDGAAKIDNLVGKACQCGMPAIGISDHGNLYGVPKFVLAAKKNKIKPIIGSEFYICDDHKARHAYGRSEEGEKGLFHQILFAKNEEGYKNLIRLSSISFTEGFYYKPRIDKALLKRHHQGLVASTCCLASEINQKILMRKLDDAEELFRWYLDLFGEDYYVELQRHGLRDQDACNQVLLGWASKYNVKVIATNDVHYVNQEDSEAHDLLLALQTASDYSDKNRFRFTGDDGQLNSSFYFKTQDEMGRLFHDLPHTLENTLEIADKCSFELKLTGDLFLPTYRVPEGFGDMDAYLAFLSWEGAKKKYGEIGTDLSDRIDLELRIIKQMGFAGYFLIVQEFTNEARKRGVMVGPGRGSAAGSVVAYCTGIIDIDPLQYSLLFERFLNPERISPPDIDMDFDDEGRQTVIDFVVERYGQQSVSQIITYGTMGAKTAIRDVGRTLGIALAEVNRIAKYIPDRPGMDFEKALAVDENPDGYQHLQAAFDSPDMSIRKMLQFARTLEGTARHTGIHAAGVIIAPGAVSEYVPIALSKDKIITTQWDGPSSEKAGMLKMDFLGLRNLSIIRTALRLIKENYDQDIDIDHLDLTDAKTYALYQAGGTVATFQFESDGMRKYLRQLKPTTIEDLIAMNALYRPGPMDNIPLFIDRKTGRVEITYPHPMLEGILKNTYGIMVYQEQIMQAAQIMAGYSLGGADLLRRAMGKKKADEMAKEREKFVQGALANGVDEKQAGEVFDSMEKFAQYGFNKSHSAAYSVLAFRTAYLKAHYPAEYMTAVLSHTMDSIEKLREYMEECQRMGISVLPPSVNESEYLFSTKPVNDGEKAWIRFGLAAIKGMGQAAAEAVIAERASGGKFESVFDLVARVGTKYINKKTLESLVYAGAMDCFEGLERWQYFPKTGTDETHPLDLAVQYGQQALAAKLSPQASLFGGADGADTALQAPQLAYKEPWPLITKLNYEREVIGMYLSAHPLDRFKLELGHFASTSINQLEQHKNKQVRVGGIITQTRERLSKAGSKFGVFTLEDYSGALEFTLFKDDYAKFKGFLEVNNCVLLTGKYIPKFGDESSYELRINQAVLLDGMLERESKHITLKLGLGQVQPATTAALDQALVNHKGKCAVYFELSDHSIPAPVVLHSHTHMVSPNHELLETLDRLNITYTLK